MKQFIIKITKKICIRWKNRTQKGVKISWTADVSISSVLENMCMIHPYVSFKGTLGMGSYIGNHSILTADIGRFTSIAPFVVCSSGIHPYTYPFASTSPCFFSLNKSKKQCGSTFAQSQLYTEERFVDEKRKIAIKIGNDCWIGTGAFLVGGITIGDGAVILAHAVVTKDVPPYAIVGGVPAKILKYRFEKEDIDWLLKTRWWDNSFEWFSQHWKDVADLSKIKTYYSHMKNS